MIMRESTQRRGIIKRESWFKDQYEHPHESKHTIGEVINWLELNNFDFNWCMIRLSFS